VDSAKDDAKAEYPARIGSVLGGKLSAADATSFMKLEPSS
jgi:hypothetical protein